MAEDLIVRYIQKGETLRNGRLLVLPGAAMDRTHAVCGQLLLKALSAEEANLPMHRLVRAMGWRLAVVKYYEWDGAPDKVCFVGGLLSAARAGEAPEVERFDAGRALREELGEAEAALSASERARESEHAARCAAVAASAGEPPSSPPVA